MGQAEALQLVVERHASTLAGAASSLLIRKDE
jgi:hypothetical protein